MNDQPSNNRGKYFGMILLLIVLFVITWHMGGKEFWTDLMGPPFVEVGEGIGVIEIIKPAKGGVYRELEPGTYDTPSSYTEDQKEVQETFDQKIEEKGG